jgi:subtilisin-like proprotein convertase family protein
MERTFTLRTSLRFLLFVVGSISLARSTGQVATSYAFGTPTTSTWTPITGGTQLWNTTFLVITDLNPFDDNVSSAQTIPAFTFNGVSYTQMYVSTNGFITFGAAPATNNYAPIASTGTYAGAISAVGCDLHNTTNAITGTRDVRWQTVGSGPTQEVVVQWRGVRRKSVANEGFAFQIRLHIATGQIKVVYGPFAQGPGSNAVIFPQVGLRGLNNTFATNVNNVQVGAGDTWAAPTAGSANTNTSRLTSAAPAKSWTSGLTYTWTPCSSPTVAFSVVENCGAAQFSVNANITNFGLGSSNTVSYSVDYGTPTTLSVGTLGVTTLGPFPATSIVNVTVSSAAANCGSARFTAFSSCNVPITCGTTTVVTHCYSNFDTRTFAYSNTSPGEAMAITFLSGCLDPADVITLFDGTSNADPVITAISGVTDLSGIVVQSLGQSIFMEISSTASNSCADGGQGCPWVFEVECVAGCLEPNGTVTTSTNCGADQFTLTVDVTDTGDGATTDLSYSVNGGVPLIVPGLGVGASEVVGPFAIGSSVHVKLLHETNGVCDKNLGTFLHNAVCPPVNDLCSNATVLTVNLPAQCPAQAVVGRTTDAGTESAAPSCAAGGPIRDVWYSFTTAFNASPLNINIAGGTIGHYGVELYTACGGTLISCTPNSPSVVAFNGAGAFTTYYVRVFTNTALGAAGTFSICVSANLSPSSCGTTIADPGGAGAYPDNVNVTNTYCPTVANQIMTMTFSSFETESGFDFLRVYDGPNTSSTLVGTYSGSTVPGPIVSTHPSGCLTTRFTSDAMLVIIGIPFPNTNAGYSASLSCCQGPYPTATASSNGPVCQGATLQLSLSTDIGTLFSWTGPNGFTSSLKDPQIPNVGLAASGTYTVIVRNGANGCPVTTSVTVGVLPNVTIAGTTPSSASICAGTVQSLSVSASSAALLPVNSTTGGAITINALGNAAPYPSTIAVSGLPTTGATVASVRINGFSHTYTQDVDILLRSPNGTNVILMSDRGGTSSISGVNFVFQDGAALMGTGALTSGTYRCSNTDTGDSWPAPGPGTVNNTGPLLSAFTGNLNGTWSLYAYDDASGDSGSITSWSITFNVPATLSYAWTPSGGSMVPSNGLASSVNAAPTASQTYTVTVGHSANACTRQASIPVTVTPAANAGTNGTLSTCSTTASNSLFAQLGGSPQSGGTWSGPSAVVAGNYNATTMSPGAYTYTVAPTAPCTAPAAATVVVSEQAAPDAGNNGSLSTCSSTATNSLFAQLGGTPDGGGVWSGPSTMVADNYDATTMVPGTYVYTVNAIAPCVGSAAASVDVTEQAAPNAGTNGSITLCVNDAPVPLTGQLGGSPDAGGSWTGPDAQSHGSTFVTGSDAAGAYTYTVTAVAPCLVDASATVNVAYDNTDTDGDGVIDCIDDCPALFGQNGDFCDANPGAGYTLGQISTCNCVPVACTTNLNIIFNPDGVTDIQWELRQQGSNVLVQSGGGIYPPAPEYSLSTCLPNGDFYFVVTSSMGGIVQNGVQGGYRLETAGGSRLIDNRNNFNSGMVSQVAGGEGFSLPVGPDRTIYVSSDKLDWRNNEYIVVNDMPAVSAQYGIDNMNNGYQMWWFDPNGGYSFRRFQNHATNNGQPAGPTRACHFRVNGWTGNQLQPNVLYNVKVRHMLNGVYANWGAATRFMLDPNRADCPLAQLMDIPGNTYLSCGGSRPIGSSQAHLVHARPVRRMVNNAWENANKYQFRFRIPAEMVEVTKTSATGQYFVNTTGLQPCKQYLVDVRASFDNGATWCTSYPGANPYAPQWGRVCVLNTTGCATGGGQNMAIEDVRGIAMEVYPNPNNGHQLFLSFGEQVDHGRMEIRDAAGREVRSMNITSAEGSVVTIDLNGSLAAGSYYVTVRAGERWFGERLIVQP